MLCCDDILDKRSGVLETPGEVQEYFGTKRVGTLHPGLYSSVGMQEGQTDTHRDARDQYAFRLGYASCEI